MRARQKFMDLALYVPTGVMDVLAAGADRRGRAFHVAHSEVESLVRKACELEAERVIRDWATADEVELA